MKYVVKLSEGYNTIEFVFDKIGTANNFVDVALRTNKDIKATYSVFDECEEELPFS